MDEPLRATIFHNGVLIHNDVWVYVEVARPYKRPLILQDHKGPDLSFRNLWIVPDVDYDQSLDDFRGNFGNARVHFVEANSRIRTLN